MKLITTFFLLMLIASCTTNSKSFVCNCNTSHVAKNDSIIKSQFIDSNPFFLKKLEYSTIKFLQKRVLSVDNDAFI